MPNPIVIRMTNRLMRLREKLSNFIHSPQVGLLMIIAPYLAAEIIAAIAYTINASEGQNEMQNDWHQLGTLVNDTIPALIKDFCCQKNTWCDKFWCADCSSGGDINLITPVLPDSFTTMHKLVNLPSRVSYTAYTNFATFTTFVPVIFGVIALGFVYEIFDKSSTRLFSESLRIAVFFGMLSFFAIYPFIFFTDFSSLSGARFSADELCNRHELDPTLTIANPYNSSSLFLPDFYQHIGPVGSLFLTLAILMINILIVGLVASLDFRKRRQAEIQLLVEEGRPLIERPNTAAVAVAPTPVVAVVPKKKALTYQDKIDAIDKKDPGLLLKTKGGDLSIFFCPISYELMHENPVLISSGNTFERASIAAHFQFSHTNPMDGTVISDISLRSNTALKATIREWIDRQYQSLCAEEIAAAEAAAEAERAAAAQAKAEAEAAKPNMAESDDDEHDNDRSSWVGHCRGSYMAIP